MQVKTIKKTIITKMESWLKTITDKELRNDVRDNILLTGGSICNLLQQEDVNDYDLYFMDMDVLVRLCKYYTSGINQIEILDGRQKEAYMDILDARSFDSNNYNDLSDEEMADALTEEEDFAQRSIAIRNLQPAQVKMYMRDPAGYKPKLPKGEKGKKYTISFISPNAISLHGDIQIVTRFTGSPSDIHKTFDFVHATNYFTYAEGLVFNNEALLSIMSKQLYYQGSFYPVSSVIRVKKFLKRGWNITAGEQLKMIYQCSKLNLDDPDVLEEQLVGVDVAYFSTLLQIMRSGEIAGDNLSEHLMEAIDKVFNSYEYDLDKDPDHDDEE